MTPQELAQLLGLSPDELNLADKQALPRDDTARGYAAESLKHIAERLDAEGDVVDVLPAGGVVQHLQWALGTYFVAPGNDRERLEVVSGAFLELGDGEMLVSGREGPAVLRISAPGVPSRAYVLQHGGAELWSIGNRTALALAVPALSSFTRGIAGSPEIEAEFQQLRVSDVALERFAAAGLLLRFWVPSDREVRRQQLLALALEDSPLLVAVRGWYSTLDAATRAAAPDVALAEVGELSATLAELAATEEDTRMRELASRVALGRDRLESIRRLLIAGGDGSVLATAIRSLDDLAATHLTQLADAGVADERLRRVLASEPDAWWGVISG
jgi:hypothetical protein